MHRNFAQRGDQERLERLLEERGEHEQAPDAVDDARDAGEQLDGDADRAAQPLRAKLGQEHRDHQTDRHRDQHRDQRGDERAVDRSERAEVLGDRIPALADQEPRAEFAERGPRADNERYNYATQQQQHEYRGRAGQVPEGAIAELEPGQHFGTCRRHVGTDGATLQRQINHFSSPRGLHWLLPVLLFSGANQPASPPSRKSSYSQKEEGEGAPDDRRPFPLVDQLDSAISGLPSLSLICADQDRLIAATVLSGIGT